MVSTSQSCNELTDANHIQQYLVSSAIIHPILFNLNLYKIKQINIACNGTEVMHLPKSDPSAVLLRIPMDPHWKITMRSCFFNKFNAHFRGMF